MSRIAEIHENLQTAWNTLNRDWSEVREGWRDALADQFEREFWSDWERCMPQTLDAIECLEQTLSQAMAQTSPDR